MGNSSVFNQLVQSGNVKVATQLANAVLQTVEQSDTTATKEKIAVGNTEYYTDSTEGDLLGMTSVIFKLRRNSLLK